MSKRNPDILKVMRKRCSKCLFSNAKIVSDARRDQILAACNETGQAFECHEATIAGLSLTCRGFYDAKASLIVRLADQLGRVEFCDIELTAAVRGHQARYFREALAEAFDRRERHPAPQPGASGREA